MQAQLGKIESDLRVNADTARASAQIARVTRDRDVNVALRDSRRSTAGISSIISQLAGAQYLRALIQHINMATLQLVQIIGTPRAGVASVIGGTLYLAFSKINKQLPAFQRFQTEIGRFEGAWNRLRNTVQTNVFGALAREIGPLGRTYMPLLQRGLDGVSRAIGSV